MFNLKLKKMKNVIAMLIAVFFISLTANAENPVKYKRGWSDKNCSETIGIWEGRSKDMQYGGFVPVIGINTLNEVRMYFKNKIYKTTAVKRNKKGTKFIIVMVDEFGSAAEMTMKQERDDYRFYYVEFVDAKESLVFYVKRENRAF